MRPVKNHARKHRKIKFDYVVSSADIRDWLRLSARHKLRWLEAANVFNEKVLRGRTLEIWEAFRAGKI